MSKRDGWKNEFDNADVFVMTGNQPLKQLYSFCLTSHYSADFPQRLNAFSLEYEQGTSDMHTYAQAADNVRFRWLFSTSATMQEKIIHTSALCASTSSCHLTRAQRFLA